METTLSITSPRPSPPLCRRNVQNRAQFSMRLIDPTLLQRVAAENAFRFRLKNHITSISPKFMADEPKKTESQPEALTVGERRDEEKIGSEKTTADPPVPPPPEKPLPGDCCGSGCVRCVWDVYYEELEEYDKLYKGGETDDQGEPLEPFRERTGSSMVSYQHSAHFSNSSLGIFN